MLSLINANSPAITIMLGAAKAYAEANQAVIMTPFILAGRWSPATAAGAATQTLAEALAGMAYVQLGAPWCAGSLRFVRVVDVDAVGGADVRNAGACARAVRARRLRPQARVPFRSGGSLTASKAADAQAAYESANTLAAHDPRRRELRAARRGLARGRAHDGLREVRARSGPVRADARPRQGMDLSPNGQAVDAIVENGPGHRFLGTAHAGELRDRVLPVRDRRQQLVRAVGTRGVAGRCDACEHGLEAHAGRVRGAADRRGEGRGASRMDRAEEGELRTRTCDRDDRGSARVHGAVGRYVIMSGGHVEGGTRWR